MPYKIIFFFISNLFLISCVNDQVSDIKKSVAYNLDGYQINIKSPQGLCINSDLAQEKKKSLVLVFTECIRNPTSGEITRRPISSVITVKFQNEPGLNSYLTISDFINSTNVKLNSIFNLTNNKIVKSYQRENTLYLSLTSNNVDNSLGISNKFWKTLGLYENIMISTSAYGFSKKTSNYSSYKDLEKKLSSVVNSIKITKLKKKLTI